MTQTVLHELLEFFGQEQACYTSLLDLSRDQRSLIENDRIDELLRILGRKQEVLDRVARIEADLAPYKQRWQEIRRTLDQVDRQVLDLALATVGELLAELIAVEKESEQALVSCRNRTYEELTQAVRGNAVHRAYAGRPAPAAAQYLDVTE